MKELISYIAAFLVDQPEAVEVNEVDKEDVTVLTLRVAQGDLGKIIGKQGRTARAIRSLLSAAAGRQNKKARLDILE